MKRLLTLVFIALTHPLIALAGPQFVDETGFAASGYDVVSYFSIKQSAVGVPQENGAKGNASITAQYNGAKWAFSSVENRDTFLKDPAQFAPQYNGHCAYGVAQGGKVPANPTLWRIVEGKLYFNVTKDVVGFWEQNIPGNLKKSEKKWPKIEPRAASNRTIPFFMSEAPLAN